VELKGILEPFKTNQSVLGLGYFSSLSLCSHLFQRGQATIVDAVEQVVIEITAPCRSSSDGPRRPVEKAWLKYLSFVDLREENTRLKKEVDDLRMQNDLYRELVSTHARLRELLQFKESIRSPMVAAQVIGRDPTGWFESISSTRAPVPG